MKTLIAVPCMDQVPAQFASSLAMLQKTGEVAVAFNVGSLVYTSRNQLALRAINMGADYVFWLDSDMMFEPDTLERMLKTCEEKNIDFLSGLYFRRVAPFTPVLFDTLEMTENECKWTEPKDIPDDIFEIGGCGFGCVLMKKDVLFMTLAEHKDMFTPMNGVGEDLSFCWRARQSGFKIYCDPAISLGHIGHQIITRDFYRVYKGTKENGNVR